MVAFRISVLGDKQAAARIEGLGANARNPRPALEEIYLTVLDIVEENFDTEGARAGRKWQRLSLGYLVQKIKRGGNPKILQSGLDTNDVPLKTAMTTYRNPEQLVRIDRFGITFAPKQLRGRVHQKGSPSRNLPARPFIQFTEQDRLAFAREILRHIVKRKKGLSRTARIL